MGVVTIGREVGVCLIVQAREMVFESVLTDLLNRFLKPYVKKLDTSQLKLGIWGGMLQCLVCVWVR